MLNRDIINQAKYNRDRVVPCSADGVEDFLVLELNLAQRNEFDSKIETLKDKINTPEYILELSKLVLFHCLCNEDGSKVLHEEDLEGFEELPSVYNNVVQECMRVNYMLPKQVDEVKKKSSPQQEN